MGGHDPGGAPGEGTSTGTTNAGYLEGSAPTKGVALSRGVGVESGCILTSDSAESVGGTAEVEERARTWRSFDF